MRCPGCGEEVLLAEQCPYCGRRVPQEKGEGEVRTRTEPKARGEFRGRMGRGAIGPGADGREGAFSLVRLLRFLADPRVSLLKKAILFAGLFYILSPIDVLPGALFPGIGWLDDVAVGTLLWRWLSRELQLYRN